ncbi:AN1-type zinc finger protein 2A-like isoform X1 [Bombyx mandarina]|uniref:AN1-type domain-containing protein n=3 Tax=Bombyx TaxID=7090 RepID=A0A8R1WER9_BOMMO|nr:AN1-type zinc finger protein 2A [Bombyx mori]XP_028034509.1 AN1-type zinc finger protein 2A-like isoform X1 [Bombyx mandarina]
MEFPHLGKNCSYESCNKLDFLPMKCGACREVFCADHFAYAKHECPEPNVRDVQVPVCPLCGAPVPGRRGQPPDLAVGAHIDNQCTSDPAVERRKKVFTNRCSYKSCKRKEMVPLVCSECALNFCLRHRHTADHLCEGKLAAKRRQAAKAAMARMRQNESLWIRNEAPLPSAVSSFSEVQGNMTEDEALAHALALSMQENVNIESGDTSLARALTRQRVGGDQPARCTVS